MIFSLHTIMQRKLYLKTFDWKVTNHPDKPREASASKDCWWRLDNPSLVYLVGGHTQNEEKSHKIGTCMCIFTHIYANIYGGRIPPSTDRVNLTSIPLPAKAWGKMVTPTLGISVPESMGLQPIILEMPQKLLILSSISPQTWVTLDVIVHLDSALLTL